MDDALRQVRLLGYCNEPFIAIFENGIGGITALPPFTIFVNSIISIFCFNCLYHVIRYIEAIPPIFHGSDPLQRIGYGKSKSHLPGYRLSFLFSNIKGSEIRKKDHVATFETFAFFSL